MFNYTNKLLLSFCIFLLSTSIIGCATIFKGSKADIKVKSNPSNARVLVDDVTVGSTPTTISIKRKDQTIKFAKKGYETVPVRINKKFDFGTTVIGNLFSWNLVGIVVDVASGAAYSLEPSEMQINLADLRSQGLIPENPTDEQDTIHVIMLTKKEWQAISK